MIASLGADSSVSGFSAVSVAKISRTLTNEIFAGSFAKKRPSRRCGTRSFSLTHDGCAAAKPLAFCHARMQKFAAFGDAPDFRPANGALYLYALQGTNY
ncbi:hypothetical protein [Desulfovibrio sp. ZJ369]|uniref:hypothetical protein n=1 Tax=Desulfovibrio sp. ZJ369 TaxID=2709793 RepID=UPI0013EA4FCB|nr:hypothetical protein [Desulfovibrio sp. ZJ369]